MDFNTLFMIIMMTIIMAGREEEGKMRFYDFKRRLGDKGSEVMIMIMIMIMMMIMMILFDDDDNGSDKSVCKV